MSEVAQLITSIATLIAAIGALVMGLRNSHKIEQVHQATNGMMARSDALIAKASKAEGNLAGRAELKQEQKNS